MEGYLVTEEIYRGERRVVRRAVREKDGTPVILKSSFVDIPSEREVAAVRHEHEILTSLSAEGVPRAYELLFDSEALHLVLEDLRGTSLASLMQSRQPDLTSRLDIAIGLSTVLERVHGEGVIHRDVNPSNVLVDDRGAVTLIDFSISTRQLEKHTPVSHATGLEGTLPYLSPEQTGRMNRPVDHRSDLYSLGATLFELFVGRPPFESADPMQLVYSHLAVPPPAVCEEDSSVPAPIGAIIGKLLEKAPEDRYQSAAGVVHDLISCRNATREALMRFVPGQHDVRDRFSIPRRLYGREAESAELMEAFERVAQGATEFVLIAGYSGIGKSALVNSVQPPVTRKRGYFVAGKFDQLKLTVPYSALVSAMSELVAQVLTEPDETLSAWREKLVEALGANGQVVIDVIPEVEHIIGPQPAAGELGLAESRTRFRHVFRSFVGVFCRPEHPLVVFLDDMQWVDPASLALLDTLLTDEDSHHLLVLAAYRDNEVDDAHPLTSAVNSLASETNLRVGRLSLGPLGADSVRELLLDTLHCTPDAADSLGRLLMEKTGGNPFFLKQFLMTLNQRGVVCFDDSLNCWTWDETELATMTITSNVVELMVARLEDLPRATTSAASFAACVGARFEVAILKVVAASSVPDVDDALAPAIEAGLIVPDVQRRGIGETEQDPLVLRFIHDRVQQAAYSLLNERARAEAHLGVGRTLKGRESDPASSDKLFQIVDHLNAGVGALEDPAERREVAQLNLEAARKAVAANAYAASSSYAKTALELLPEDRWDSDYTTTRDLHRVLSDAEYLKGDFEQSQELISEMLPRLKTPLEQAEAQAGLVVQQTLSSLYGEAMETCCQALELLGVQVRADDLEELLREQLEHHRQMRGRLGSGSVLDLPQVGEREIAVALRLLANLLPLAYIADPLLCRVAAARMVNLSLEYGNTPDSAFGLAFFGMVHASALNMPVEGYDYGQLAMQLASKYSDSSQACRTAHVFCAFINHWSRHLREFDDINRRGFQAGLQAGELQFAGYHRYNRSLCLFHLGTELHKLTTELEELIRFSRKTRNEHATDPIVGVMRVALDLAGETPEAGSFVFEDTIEADFQSDLRARAARPTVAHYSVLQSQVFYLYGRYEEAQARCELAAEHLRFASSHMSVAVHDFYAALVGIALAGEAGSGDLSAVHERLERLRQWAEGCPENFAHKALLVEAELARAEDDGWRAAELYDRSIQLAGESGYLQEETLARERAGLFWLSRGRRKTAAVYLSEAHHGYRLWGANRKAEMLAQEHGELIAGAAAGASAAKTTSMPFLTLVSSSGAALDFAAVMRSARTIAKEVDLDVLVKQLVRTASETAGAQQAHLVLAKDGQLFVEASSDFEKGETRLSPPVELGLSPEVPESVVNYVMRTQRTVSVPSVSEDSRFARDESLQNTGACAALCVPIRIRGEVAGALYLQHSLAEAVFTSDRVEILESLAAQAAVSLVNAELYEKRKQTERELRNALKEVQELKARLEQENEFLQEEIETQRSDEIVGESRAIKGLLQEIDLVAGTDASVLVLGESGTGKELVAREIHKRSQRSDGPMIRVNCASVPRELYESEFFGHVKGAFTGATRDRAGRFEMADGGTLFLDEVGEIPLELQSKLLRVLQEAQFERIGEERTRSVDVRIVAATNRDLQEEVAAGRFREDLYYRLNVIPIAVVPLRDRKDDIPLLAERFIQMACKRLNRPMVKLGTTALDQLASHDWPGNVRELQNEIERALILSRSGSPTFDIQSAGVPSSASANATSEERPPVRTYDDLKALEREVVRAALAEANGKVNGSGGAAQILGVNASTLFSRMKSMGIERR